MKVRPATPEDTATMAEIFITAARAAWGFAGDEALDAMQPPELAGGELVVEDKGRVVGFAVVKGCELDLLYTSPDAWGRGAGRALLVAAEHSLRDAGCTEVTLWTEERNERARRIYQASGWRPGKEVRERVWNGAPLRELRYRKLLAPAKRA
jgi:GNAT superfamily N-acetyltransferase